MTYLLDNDKHHAIIVTQVGLAKGLSTDEIEGRRVVVQKGRYNDQAVVPVMKKEDKNIINPVE